jgi:hypothetical protein
MKKNGKLKISRRLPEGGRGQLKISIQRDAILTVGGSGSGRVVEYIVIWFTSRILNEPLKPRPDFAAIFSL